MDEMPKSAPIIGTTISGMKPVYDFTTTPARTVWCSEGVLKENESTCESDPGPLLVDSSKRLMNSQAKFEKTTVDRIYEFNREFTQRLGIELQSSPIKQFDILNNTFSTRLNGVLAVHLPTANSTDQINSDSSDTSERREIIRFDTDSDESSNEIIEFSEGSSNNHDVYVHHDGNSAEVIEDADDDFSNQIDPIVSEVIEDPDDYTEPVNDPDTAHEYVFQGMRGSGVFSSQNDNKIYVDKIDPITKKSYNNCSEKTNETRKTHSESQSQTDSNTSNCWASSQISHPKILNEPSRMISRKLLSFKSSLLSKKNNRKRGPLAGKLQNLIKSQMSFFRIWRYQMTQSRFLGTCDQYISLKINRRNSEFGSQAFNATVINDKFDLLGETFRRYDISGIRSGDSLKKKFESTIIAVMIPEIVGTVNINEKNALRIYPPWEIMDADKSILSILYFNIIIMGHSEIEDMYDLNREIVVGHDHCACLEAKKMVEYCNFQSVNSKPNVIQYLFDD